MSLIFFKHKLIFFFSFLCGLFFFCLSPVSAYYNPGETLNPACVPGTVGCDINPVTPVINGGTGIGTTGLDGQVLKMVSGALTWASDIGGSSWTAGTGLSTSGTAMILDLTRANTWTGIQSFSNGFTLGSNTYTDLAGTGLNFSSGTLSSSLGTSIESAEITDSTIVDVDISGTAAIAWVKLNKSGAKISDLDVPTYTGNIGKVLSIGSSSTLEWKDFGGDIGGEVTGATPSSTGGLLYVDAAGNLAQDTGFLWDTTTKKLTVTGGIDPVFFSASDTANGAYYEAKAGQNAAVSIMNTGRLRYNATLQKWQISENTGAYTNIATTDGLNLQGANGINITGTGVGSTISLSTTGVVAATYGSGTSIPTFTVDAYGRVISAFQTLLPTYTTGSGLTSPSTNVFALDLGSSNVWTALQTFNGNVAIKGSGNTSGTSSLSVVNSDNTNGLNVSDNGSVNIGYKLEVVSPGQSLGEAQIYLKSASGNSNRIIFSDGGNNRWGISNNALNNLFSIYNYNNWSTALSINNSGKVGINTASPNFTLDVAGTGNFTTLAIGGTVLNTTTGSLLYGNGLSFSNLNIGTSNQVLLSDGTNPTWMTIAGLGQTYSAGIGLTSPSTGIIALDLGSSNTWTALQTFNGNISIGSSSLITNLNSNYLSGYRYDNLPYLTSLSWGSIGGTLSDQTDLQNALNNKENNISIGSTLQYYRGDKTWATLPIYTTGSGLTMPSTGIIALDLNNANAWTGLQTFNNGLSIGNTNVITNADRLNYLSGISSTNGSLIVGVGSSLGNLNIGTSNQVLISDGTNPTWVTVSGLGQTYSAGTGLTSPSTGIIALDLGSSNIWAAYQTFTGGIGVTNVNTQSAALAYYELVVDSATGTIMKAPVINKLNDVTDNTVTDPSTLVPEIDQSWIVAVGSIGDWAGQDNKIASWDGSSWGFYSPLTNDRTSVSTGTNAGNIYTFNGTAWVIAPVSPTTNWSLSGNVGSNGDFLGTTNNSGLTFKTNNLIRMSIGASGGIGIGTTNTSEALSVNGLMSLANQSAIYAASNTSGYSKIYTKAATGDGYDSFSKFVTHFDGTNGSTSFSDSSPLGTSFSSVNGAAVSTSSQKFGTGSGNFNGTNQYLTSPTSTSYDIVSGQAFTFDAWIYPVSVAGTRPIFTVGRNTANDYHQLRLNGNRLEYIYVTAGTVRIDIFPATTVSVNTWNHVAIVKDTNATANYYLYLNGTQIGTSANATARTFTSLFNIGSNVSAAGSGYFSGYIDEARFSTGTMRYTSAFTPNTSPYGSGLFYRLANGAEIELGNKGGGGSSSGTSLSNLLAASATNSIDNLNFGQNWDWSTLDSSTAQSLSTGSTLFSGNILGLNSTGNDAGVTGNLINLGIAGSTSNAVGLNIANAGKGLSLNVQGATAFKAGSTYTTVGLTNDVDLGNASFIRLDTSGAAQTITGIANGVDGKLLTLTNADTALSVTLSNESTSSFAANRIVTGTGADLTMASGASVNLIYDATDSRWRVVGGSGGGSSQTVASCTSTATCTTALGGVWNKTLTADATTAFIAITLPTSVSNNGKQIEITKVDNSINYITIAPFAGQTINGSTSPIYLYSLGDSIVLRSDGTNSVVVADNRNSVGQSKGYLRAKSTSAQSNVNTNTIIAFDAVESQYGSNITFNNSGDSFTLKAGKTYHLTGNIPWLIHPSASYFRWQWYDGTSYVGTGAHIEDVTTAFAGSGGGSPAEAVVTPTVDTTYTLRASYSGLTATVGDTANGSALPSVYIEEISTPQNVINTVDYGYYSMASGGWPVGSTVNTWTKVTGNIPTTNTTMPLIAGKSYRLSAALVSAGGSSSDYYEYAWYIGGVLTGNRGNAYAMTMNTNYSEQPTAIAYYTPSANTTAELRITVHGGGMGIDGTYSYAEIIQFGATSSTGLPLNNVISAIAAGAMDNTNFTQTWNWSTADDETAMTFAANALTSGKGLNVSSTATAMTGNLTEIGLTGNNAANTGNLLKVSSTGASSTATGVNIDTASSAGLALSASGAIATRKGTDYSTTGTSVDTNFGNTSLVRLTGASAQTIDSIAGGVDGEILTVVNAAVTSATIRDASTATTAIVANKILTGTGANITLAADASIMLVYDSGASRWRVVGGTGGGSSATTIQSINTTGSVSGWGYTVKADSTTASVVATLPTAAGNSGKQIEVVKTDNTTNIVRVVPFGSEAINNSTNAVYLYSQGDSVIIRSDGTSSYIVSDNRSSVGQSKNYLRGYAGATPQTFSAAGDVALTSTNSYGSNISLNSNQITLKAGSTYRLYGKVGGYFNNNNGQANIAWVDSGNTKLTNSSGARVLAINFGIDGTPTDSNEAGAVITPSSDTIVKLRVTYLEQVFYLNQSNSEFYIEEISTPQNVINTVDNVFARVTANVTTANTTIPVTPVVGNIEVSNNMFNLKAGKTYELEAFIEFNGGSGSVWAEYVWTDSSGTYLPTSTTGLSVPVQSLSADSSIPTRAIITPTQDMSVKVMTTGIVSNVVGIALTRSYFKITQIGSSAQTGLALNNLIAATGTGAIDNLNFGQTWSWSTATTQTAMTMNANALTTGTGLAVTTSNNSLNSTNGLLYVANTGTSTSGILARLQANSTAGSGLTVLTNGNVGIGTANPLQRVSISGTSVSGVGSESNISAYVNNGIRINGSGTSGQDAITYQAGTGGGGAAIAFGRGTGWDTFMSFYTNPNSSATGGAITERMRIDASGNVGIGTTAPTAALDVVSITTSTGLSIQAAGAVAFKAGSTYTTAGSANDVAFGNSSFIRLDTSGAAQTITGIAGGVDGRLLTLTNADGASSVLLENLSASSLGFNRIITGTGSNLLIEPSASVNMIYDATSWRWRVVGGTGGTNNIQSLSSTGSVSGWGYTTKVDATTASFTATLPTAAGNSGKLIEITKIDNSTNAVSVSAFGSETINGSTDKIYLYSQGDSIVLRSDGTNSFITADNRNSVGQSKGYMFLTGGNLTVSNGTQIPFTSVRKNYGGDISQSGNGVLLKAGKTYELTASISIAGANAQAGIEFYDTTASAIIPASTNNSIKFSANSTNAYSDAGDLSAAFTPTIDSIVVVRAANTTAGTPILADKFNIEVLSTPQNVINTVDYAYGSVAAPSGGGDMALTNTAGNMPLSGGYYTLKAGKTYQLFSTISNRASGWYNYQWVDNANNGISGVNAGNSVSANSGDTGTNSPTYVIFTPTTNTQVKLRAYSVSTSDSTGGHYWITQLGSSAQTGLALNNLIAATGTGAIDNLNYSQTWNWNTFTTGTALSIGTSSLTTGSALSLTSSSSSFNSTNGLLYVSNTGSTAAGVVARIQSLNVMSNGDVGIGTTNPIVKLEVTDNNAGGYVSILSNTANTSGGHVLKILGGANGGTAGAHLIGFFRPDGTIIGRIQQDSLSAVSYNTTSDERTKENIVDTKYSVLDLMKINVRDFNFKDDPNHQSINGFIAQELQKIYPGAVSVGSDEVDENGNLTNPWGVDYGKLTPLLVKSIQDQQEEIIANTDNINTLDLRTQEDKTTIADDLNNKINNINDEIALIKSKLESTGAVTFKSEVAFEAPAVFKVIAEFIDKVIFRGRVQFEDKDMAGFATILVGQSSVEVTFENEYEFKPIVNITLVGMHKEMTYALKNVTSKGFIVEIDPTQNEDIEFNWMALMVKDAKTFVITPTPTETPSPTSTSTPTEVPSPTPSIEATTITETPTITPSVTPEPVEVTPTP